MRNVLIIMMRISAAALWVGAAHAQVQTSAPAAALSGVVLSVRDGSAVEGAKMHAVAGIKGSVKDVTKGGAAVEGATVTYTYVGLRAGKSGEVKSDQNGEFEIFPLAPGDYSLSVAADRYKERDNILRSVVSGQTTVIELKMRKKTTIFQALGRMYGGNGVLVLLFSIAAVALIFTLTASWLIRKAEKQS